MNDGVRSRHWRNSIIVVVVAVGLVYLMMPNSANWKEEIDLSDGRRLIVDRGLTYGGRSEPGVVQHPVEKWTLGFRHPDTGERIKFESPGGLELLRLDVDRGTFYIATSPSRGDAYQAYGCPNPRFVFYKYGNGWEEVSPLDAPATFTVANLPLDTQEYEKAANAGGLISAAQIDVLNNLPYLGAEQKKISRKPQVWGCSRPAAKPPKGK